MPTLLMEEYHRKSTIEKTIALIAVIIALALIEVSISSKAITQAIVFITLLTMVFERYFFLKNRSVLKSWRHLCLQEAGASQADAKADIEHFAKTKH